MIRYLKTIAEILPVLAVLGGAGYWAVLEAGDNRYVQLQQLADFARNQRIEDLEDKIDDLTIKQELGQATPYDKARLKNLERKLQRITE